MPGSTPAVEFGVLSVAGFPGIVGGSPSAHRIAFGETGFVLPFEYLRIVYAFVIAIVWFAEMPYPGYRRGGRDRGLRSASSEGRRARVKP